MLQQMLLALEDEALNVLKDIKFPAAIMTHDFSIKK